MKTRSPEFLYGVKSPKSNSLFDIKNRLTFSELCELTDRMTGSGPAFAGRVFGNPLPKDYESLGSLGRGGKIYQAESVDAEVNWTLLAIRRYRFEIALFLNYRLHFEDAFLLGDYDRAENILNKIETEICCSLWTLQSRMLLLEFRYSPEANKTFLSDTNKGVKGAFMPYLMHHLSGRSEKTLSASRYDLEIRNSLAKLTGDGAEGTREFYYFKLDRYAFGNYDRVQDVLTYDGFHSIIDRYLSLVQALKLWTCSRKLEPSQKLYLKKKITYLYNKFQDPSLESIYVLLGDGNDYNIKPKVNLSLLDLYNTGLYEECISEAEKQLNNAPSEFLYYELYVLSYLMSKRKFILPSQGLNFQNTILLELYNQLNRQIDPFQSLNNLERLLRNLQEFAISGGLNRFLNERVRHLPSWTQYDRLSLPFNHPEICCFLNDDTEKLKYLKFLQSAYGKSISIKILEDSLGDNYDKTIDKLGLPETIKHFELAKYFQANREFELAKSEWTKVKEDSESIIPIYEVAITNLFRVYVELNEFDNAIKLYVDNVLANHFLVFKIDVSQIQEKIRRDKFRNVTPAIDLPLFYTFSNGDENEKHIAYERFNISIGIQKPSQLSLDKYSGDKAKLIAFLHQTCTTDNFKHSIYIDGSKEGLSERIQVCQMLLTLDDANEDVYRSEINSLTDTLIIQEGLQQLDESKIYVNEQGLINNELREYEGLYNRYQTIAKIYRDSNKKLIILDKRKRVRLGSLEDVAETLIREDYSSDPLGDSFADIFEVITRKFLFSKFGISAYLSTRIRHGVLLGEIRPIFERFHLISQRDSAIGIYKDIDQWNLEYYYFSSSELSKLQQAFKNFSEAVDVIIQSLLKDQLQIKTNEENPGGWFDFFFDDHELSLHAINCMRVKDYSEFVRYCIEILWVRTDENLDAIRKKIQVEIKLQFNAVENACKLTPLPQRHIVPVGHFKLTPLYRLKLTPL